MPGLCHGFILYSTLYVGFPGESVVKNPPAKAGDAGDTALIPGWGRPPGGGNGNPSRTGWEIPRTEEPDG